VACSGGDDEPLTTPVDVPATVALGELPEPLTDTPTLPPPPSPPTTEASTTTTTVVDAEPIEGPISAHVDGNRVLLIGDSLLASAAERNDPLLCDALSIFGWQVEIDAEPGRGLAFPEAVLGERLLPDDELDWDAVALAFGSEVDGEDPEAVAGLAGVVEAFVNRVAPRPTVLYTLSEGLAGHQAINDAIRAIQEQHPNVLLIDWAATAGDIDDVLATGGDALSEDGLKRFAALTAAALGEAPGDGDGECLPAPFVDDSAA
jgi:hypothetical protein